MFVRISLSIKQKLYLLGVVCLLCALSLAGTGLLFSGEVERAAHVINDERFAPLSSLQDLTGHLKEVRFRLAGVLLDQMPVVGSRIHLKETMEKAPVLWKRFKGATGHLGGEGGEIVAAIDRDLPELDRFAQALDKAYASGEKKELEALLEDRWPVVQQKIVKPLDALLPSLSAATAAEATALETTAQRFRNFIATVALLGGAVALITVVLIIRSLNSGLREGLAAAQALARGELGHNIDIRSKDEMGQLLQALADMAQNLRSLVGEVAAGAHTVADTSGQIAQGNLDLSQRTEQQASTLEETASSMEELTSSVTQNAQNARDASQLAVKASDVARKGGQVVGQVVSTMNGISESSRKIADIIGVIDGIAFQTNILALNAAVEAARAGEQGRGFAVVAAEVRNLAQRSAAAAKEIKTLIGDSVDKVAAGTKLVDAAGQTMEEIVGSVKKVSDLIAEIAAASQEQSSGIGQVNTAVTQMDQVVQQNASLVEEATAATESMKQQAGSLLQLVSRFRLGATDLGRAVPERARESRKATPRKAAPSAPIQVRADPLRLTSGFGELSPSAKSPRSGEWKEFQP